MRGGVSNGSINCHFMIVIGSLWRFLTVIGVDVCTIAHVGIVGEKRRYGNDLSVLAITVSDLRASLEDTFDTAQVHLFLR